MNNINIETETDQNFFNECEQAILDRDEKIKNLLNDLSIQNVRTQQQNQLEKIESSICNTQKMFLHLKVWFKQFEEKKLAKSSKINGNLKEENECLKNQNQILSEEKRKNNEKIQFFVHGLKSQISTLKKELNDVKTQQNSNSNDFVKLLIKHKQFSLMESNKYISTQDSETNKSYDIMSLVTPHKKYSEKEMLSGFATKIKKKNVSTNTQFNDQTHRISYNRNHSLKEEYGRKSIIIQCILKNLSKKKNLKQLRDSWLKKENSINEKIYKKENYFADPEQIEICKETEKYFEENKALSLDHNQNFRISFQNSEPKGILNGETINKIYNKCLLMKNINSL